MCTLESKYGSDEVLQGFIVQTSTDLGRFELVVERSFPGVLFKLKGIVEKIEEKRKESGKIYRVVCEVFGNKEELKKLIAEYNRSMITKVLQAA